MRSGCGCGRDDRSRWDCSWCWVPAEDAGMTKRDGLRWGRGLLLGPGRGRRDDGGTEGAGRGLGAVWDVFTFEGDVSSARRAPGMAGAGNDVSVSNAFSAGVAGGAGKAGGDGGGGGFNPGLWANSRSGLRRLQWRQHQKGRPRCVQRGRFEVRSANSPSQGRGAHVRELVQSRTGTGYRGKR